MTTPSTYEERVARWPRHWQEAFIERAGILMDSGDRQALADQKAFRMLEPLVKAEAAK